MNSLELLQEVRRLKPVSYTHLDVYKRQGWSNRKIADEMGCSEGTIWNFLKKMEGRNE